MNMSVCRPYFGYAFNRHTPLRYYNPIQAESLWQPSAEVQEENTAFQLRMEMPGVDKQSIDVKVNEGILEIKGERKRSEETVSNQRWSERKYGGFSRRFILPKSVEQSQISADYSDGVLSLTLPKNDFSLEKKVEINFLS